MKLLEVYTCINMNCQPPQVLQQTRGRKSIDRFFVKYHAIQSLLHADGNVIHTRVPPLLMLPVCIYPSPPDFHKAGVRLL